MILLILLGLLAAGTVRAWFWRGSKQHSPPLPAAPIALQPERRAISAPSESRKASRVSLRMPGPPTRAPAALATSAPEAAARCARTAIHRPEPVGVDNAWGPGATSERDASERLARYLNQQELKRQPKYRLAAISTSLWLARELRVLVEADLRSEEAALARDVTYSAQTAELLVQLRLAEAAAEAARAELSGWGRPPLACDDPLVQKTALCAGYRALGTLPEGSSPEAVATFCASDELRALAELVRVDEGVRYQQRTARAMARLAYDLDHAYLVTRSVETCLETPRYLPYVEEKLKEAPGTQWKRAETLLYAFEGASAELSQAGMEPLRCEEPEVQRVLHCVLEAGVIGPTGPRCQAPELRALVARVQRR